jgi:hypothetical protein
LSAYNRFFKRHHRCCKTTLPRGFRKEYIPGWEENCENLYQEYQSTHERGLANDLLRELNDQRKQKWERTVESTNFTHSSRKAWALLRNLGANTNITPSQNQNITANDIASRILKVPINPNHVHSMKRVLRQKKRELIKDILISDEFSVEELKTALLSVKPGKAAGLDGVYAEFINNSGRKTKEWLVQLFNDILTTGKLPKMFKQAKILAILKSGKDGTDVSHYRSISLLSVVYKILERLILQHIQPLIDAAVPVSQAGFRKNRSCTEQVMALTSHIEAGFERKLKKGTIFIDLTAAYDMV